MTVAVALLTIVVAVLALLVAGLLRSHALILRRLHELGAGVDDTLATPPGPGGIDDVRPAPSPAHPPAPARPPAPAGVTRAAGAVPAAALPRPPEVGRGRTAADVSGAGPRGGAQAIRVVGSRHDTVLAFLSSGCATCHGFWDDLQQAALPESTRLVIVTKGADAESPTAVADVAPADVTVVMSSQAWEDYQVPGSPYVVHVDGPSGRVRGEGTGPNWAQVERMLLQGASDLDARRAAAGGRGTTGAAGTAGGDRGGAAPKAAADARREEEVDRVLLASGIEPGHPSLYTRADGSRIEPT